MEQFNGSHQSSGNGRWYSFHGGYRFVGANVLWSAVVQDDAGNPIEFDGQLEIADGQPTMIAADAVKAEVLRKIDLFRR